MTPKYVVVISLDGLASSDIDFVRTLPTFRWLIETGSVAQNVIGVYPTQTYPLHASLITGVYPNTHGVIANTQIQPEQRNPEWFWYRDGIKVPTLYDAARRAGLHVTSLLWPTTGGARVNCNLPEIQTTKPGQSLARLMLSHGTPLFIIGMLARYRRLLGTMGKSNIDDFTTAIAAHMLRRKKTNLLLLHLLDLDGTRHETGFSSEAAEQSIVASEKRVGTIVQAVKEASILPHTAFVVFGDHAYLDVKHAIHINSAFSDAGLLEPSTHGGVEKWDAWANCCDGSAHIYIRTGGGDGLARRVRGILECLRDNYGAISVIFAREELSQFRTGGEMAFVAEAEAGYYFSSDLRSPIVGAAPENYKATHGYLPSREGYTSLFLASGSGVRREVTIPSIDIVDIGPTIARMMGLSMPHVDGRIVEEVLTQPNKAR